MSYDPFKELPPLNVNTAQFQLVAAQLLANCRILQERVKKSNHAKPETLESFETILSHLEIIREDCFNLTTKYNDGVFEYLKKHGYDPEKNTLTHTRISELITEFQETHNWGIE